MAAPSLTAMPETITAGLTVKYTVTHSDYPASDGWALKLYLAGISVITPINGNASGDAFAVTLSSAVTATLKAGTYTWRELVTKSGETYEAASGVVRVLPDIAQAGAGDFQSADEKMLAIVEAALEGRLSQDMESYSIAGRAVTKIPASELLAIRSQLKAAVAARARGDKWGRTVKVRFTGTQGEA